MLDSSRSRFAILPSPTDTPSTQERYSCGGFVDSFDADFDLAAALREPMLSGDYGVFVKAVVVEVDASILQVQDESAVHAAARDQCAFGVRARMLDVCRGTGVCDDMRYRRIVGEPPARGRQTRTLRGAKEQRGAAVVERQNAVAFRFRPP